MSPAAKRIDARTSPRFKTDFVHAPFVLSAACGPPIRRFRPDNARLRKLGRPHGFGHAVAKSIARKGTITPSETSVRWPIRQWTGPSLGSLWTNEGKMKAIRVASEKEFETLLDHMAREAHRASDH
jgi:hypothetical protein